GPEGVRVETASGPLFCEPARGRATVGEAVEVFVRPEAIALANGVAGPEPGQGYNRLEGRVDSLPVNGGASRGLARTRDGRLIEVAYDPGQASGPQPGEAVVLSWPAARAKCFPRQE